jgi:hypothetical protein
MSQDIFEEEEKPMNKWAKRLMGVAIATLLFTCFWGKDSKEYNPSSPIYYNSVGRMQAPSGARVAIFDDYVTPTVALGYVVDYSSAHFITSPIITITSEQNTSSTTSIPLVSISTRSTTSCTVNIVSSNNQVINVLGGTVTGLIAATGLSSMKLHVRAKGYTYDTY